MISSNKIHYRKKEFFTLFKFSLIPYFFIITRLMLLYPVTFFSCLSNRVTFKEMKNGAGEQRLEYFDNNNEDICPNVKVKRLKLVMCEVEIYTD